MATSEETVVVIGEPAEPHVRLKVIEARLKAHADAANNASWARAAASRGGFRQERVDFLLESESMQAK